MDSLKMKAKAGVTLVELLVVILIVTILSVSMLPLLQPFVTEAQYAAEAIPVIGNLRTKVALYQYDKGQLPFGDVGTGSSEGVETWTSGEGAGEDGTSVTDTEVFAPAYYALGATGDGTVTAVAANKLSNHIGMQIDVDYEDLKGKRSKPLHYQYYAISPTNNFSYVIACFGDGNGLKAGTGYAVCELNFTKQQKKYIGTWKRYKPTSDNGGALHFGTQSSTDGQKKLDYCYVPSFSDFEGDTISMTAGEPSVITNMKKSGWEF